MFLFSFFRIVFLAPTPAKNSGMAERGFHRLVKGGGGRRNNVVVEKGMCYQYSWLLKCRAKGTIDLGRNWWGRGR